MSDERGQAQWDRRTLDQRWRDRTDRRIDAVEGATKRILEIVERLDGESKDTAALASARKKISDDRKRQLGIVATAIGIMGTGLGIIVSLMAISGVLGGG